MATATLTSQLTDVSLDPGNPTSIGTGNAGASETDIQLEGSNCSAMGHAGSLGPASPSAISDFRGCYASVTSFTRTDMHLHIWVRDLYPIRNVNLGGISAYIFGSSEAIYYATGLDKGYAGGWFHFILNLDAGDRPAASLGTAPSANITRVGMVGNISVTKGESFLQNCYFDAIRRGTAGQGNTFTGGTTGDRLTFLNLADSDTSSYGLFRNINGAFFIEGPITIGSATSTTYLQVSLQTVNFTNFTVNNSTGGNTIVQAIASDYYRVVFADGTTGVTNCDLTDVTFKGVSRDVPFIFNAGALTTGDAYTSLRTTYLFSSTVTLNTLCTSDSDNFIECVTVVPGGITLTDPSFSNCDAVTLTATNDKISGGSTALHNTLTGVVYVTTNDLTKIENHGFDNTSGAGHAIEITATGTYTFTGNTFSGYGADASNDAAIYNNSGGSITINIAGGGDTPTIRNGSGASTTVVAGSVTVSVKTVDNVGANVASVRIIVEASGGAGLPAVETVTITRSGSTATVTHTAHGMDSNDKVAIRNANEIEYTGIFTITVTGANTYTYTVTGTPATPATGTIDSTFIALEGLTDASGDISASRVYASNQLITGSARKSTASPFFKAASIPGTILSASGYSQTVTMISDE